MLKLRCKKSFKWDNASVWAVEKDRWYDLTFKGSYYLKEQTNPLNFDLKKCDGAGFFPHEMDEYFYMNDPIINSNTKVL